MHLYFEFLESVRIALRAIRSSKMRAILTTLGIVIGVVSVTSMATVVNGIERSFDEQMASLGTDVVYIERWPWQNGPGSKWWEYINRPRIQKDVADAVAKRSRYADAVTAVVRTGRPISAGNNTIGGVSIGGVTATYPQVFTVDLAEGTFVSDLDERAARRVAVIGAAIADELFSVGYPVGKAVRIQGQEYRVIGVLERKGQGADSAQSEDYRVFIPFSAFRSQFGTRWRDVSVQVRVQGDVELEEAKDEIRGIVRVARRLDAKDPDNFEINEQATLREQIAPIKTAIYSIGIGLTALALLVGGIGVMNIMFVSVKERTREIGIRKAVGARRRTIMLQFLVEAVGVSVLGGVIGILLAIPITIVIRMAMPAYLGPGVVAFAFGMCLMIGIVFGLAPAWTAARSEPIDALRYE